MSEYRASWPCPACLARNAPARTTSRECGQKIPTRWTHDPLLLFDTSAV